ncbi:hypothetical protein ACRQ1B_27410 [Rhizobium panacihumi]|uniref:hypothetical protein n=1 Tax=Rhizobium panacihumi TaxID=2008450 RepID=UPI003D7B01DB
MQFMALTAQVMKLINKRDAPSRIECARILSQIIEELNASESLARSNADVGVAILALSYALQNIEAASDAQAREVLRKAASMLGRYHRISAQSK